MSVCSTSGIVTVSTSASAESNRHSSTRVACSEKIAKLTPTPSQVAPSGEGEPGHTRIFRRGTEDLRTTHSHARATRPAAPKPQRRRALRAEARAKADGKPVAPGGVQHEEAPIHGQSQGDLDSQRPHRDLPRRRAR